jgi:hypothetical protein
MDSNTSTDQVKLELQRPRHTSCAEPRHHATCDLARRRLRLRRLPCTRRRARRGIDHNGQADFECERWFCTDAGLLKILPQGIPLAHPDEAAKVVSCYFNNTHRCSRPTRRDGEGGRGRSKGHASSSACSDEDTGSAAAHTLHHHHHACRT